MCTLYDVIVQCKCPYVILNVCMYILHAPCIYYHYLGKKIENDNDVNSKFPLVLLVPIFVADFRENFIKKS